LKEGYYSSEARKSVRIFVFCGRRLSWLLLSSRWVWEISSHIQERRRFCCSKSTY